MSLFGISQYNDMRTLFIKLLILSVFLSSRSALSQPSTELPDVEVMQGADGRVGFVKHHLDLGPYKWRI